MMSDSQLSQFLGVVDTVTAPFYRGCFRLDNLINLEPLLDLNEKNAVVLHANNHFMGLYLAPSDRKSVFIDTVKVQPTFYGEELIQFLEYYCPNFSTLPFRIQGAHSKLCGPYVEYFLHQFCNNKTVDSACHFFRPAQYTQNDYLLRVWFKTTFQKTAHDNMYPKQ